MQWARWDRDISIITNTGINVLTELTCEEKLIMSTFCVCWNRSTISQAPARYATL